MTKNQIDRELQACVARTWSRMVVLYPRLRAFNPPSIKTDGRVRKMLAYYYPDSQQIRVGSRWLAKNWGIILAEIVPHEVAHHVDYLLSPIVDEEPHNENWQKIMVQFGLEPLAIYEVQF